MKTANPINAYRRRKGVGSSTNELGMEGIFHDVPFGKIKMMIVSGIHAGWEHVSVSIPGAKRCPTWEEMCYVKSLFWEASEGVMQIHPPAKDYVNNHPHCLHLWRPIDREIPLPHPWLVGAKDPTDLNMPMDELRRKAQREIAADA